jgi:hypothetical protein
MMFFKLSKNINPQRHIFIPLYLGMDQTKVQFENVNQKIFKWLMESKVAPTKLGLMNCCHKKDLITIPKQITTRFNSNVNSNKIKNLWSINLIKTINLLKNTPKILNQSTLVWTCDQCLKQFDYLKTKLKIN